MTKVKSIESLSTPTDRHNKKSWLLCDQIYSIKSLITVSMIVQILLLGILLTVISLVAQKQLLNEMTKSLRDETLADIYQYLDSFVRMPPRVAAIAGDAINKKVVDATSFNQMKVYTFSIWKSSEVTSAYYIDLVNYQLIGYRYAMNMIVFMHSFRSQNESVGILSRGPITSEGVPIMPESKTKYVFQEQPWYQVAIDNVDPLCFMLGQVYISCQISIMENGVKTGFVGVDFDTAKLTEFLLKRRRVSKRGFAFVIDNSGGIMAHSDPHTIVFTEEQIMGQLFRYKINAVDCTNTYISSSAKAILNKHGSFSAVPKNKPGESSRNFQVIYRQGRENVMVQYTTYQNNLGIDWILVAVIPEADYFRTFYIVRRANIGVSAALIFVSAIVSIVIAVNITYPISKLGSEMKQISAMDFSRRNKKDLLPNLSEIRNLRSEFNHMKDAISYFGRYVPLEVVKLLMMQGVSDDGLSLRSTDISIMFTDIASFTSIAEELHPDLLVNLLEDYFSIMSDVVLSHEGTLDKYIGDAIMAFWNMPNKVDDYVTKAVFTAIEMQKKLLEVREIWNQRGYPKIQIRIGINAGKALVGNIGSTSRISYTALGDVVNLASRIEGLNKFYSTNIMITDVVYAQCSDLFLCKPLDFVTVVGKAKPTKIYQVICANSDSDSVLANCCRVYTEAFDLYLAKNFLAAAQRFEQYQRMNPHDKFTSTMIDRCYYYNSSPPDHNWAGVYAHTEK